MVTAVGVDFVAVGPKEKVFAEEAEVVFPKVKAEEVLEEVVVVAENEKVFEAVVVVAGAPNDPKVDSPGLEGVPKVRLDSVFAADPKVGAVSVFVVGKAPKAGGAPVLAAPAPKEKFPKFEVGLAGSSLVLGAVVVDPNENVGAVVLDAVVVVPKEKLGATTAVAVVVVVTTVLEVPNENVGAAVVTVVAGSAVETAAVVVAEVDPKEKFRPGVFG